MKRFLTLIACAITLSAGAQIPYEFPYNPDADNDAFISTTDLVEFLALFGQDFASEDLFLSSDSAGAILKVGDELSRIECLSACSNLLGAWRVTSFEDIAKFFTQLTLNLPVWEDINMPEYEAGIEYMWVDETTYDNQIHRPSNLESVRKNAKLNSDGEETNNHFHPMSLANLPSYGKAECWCATQQRPRVEYSVIDSSTDTFNAILNSMAEEGWLLVPQGPFGNQITFWRWAD